MNNINILVWQWGRKGAGPKIAVEFTKALRLIDDINPILSLSRQSETISKITYCDYKISVNTYKNYFGYLKCVCLSPLRIVTLVKTLKKYKIKYAFCMMPGPLDSIMAIALRYLKIPFIVIIHDAYPHPGDGYIFQNFLQKLLIKQCSYIVSLTNYTQAQLKTQNVAKGKQFLSGWHPPFEFPENTNPSPLKNNKIHILNFGRLLYYKGLDLLEEALNQLSSYKSFELRIIGNGPHTSILDKLANHPNVSVENRWVPEEEISSLMDWADLIILPYKDASQSGIAATALAYGKPILTTKVGGLVEQLAHEQFVYFCEPNATSIAKELEKVLKLDFPFRRQKYNVQEEWKKFAFELLDQLNLVKIKNI
ncbi:hypothetical protein COMNV_01377 [Commensalibacter sp. Nvir]|uniref:glycosyltransferase n=1 Tax=Commensalibacter sp. Nvir TaxID=3069817 RepID=UPI002D30A8FF|nr:hypothetical protein COMNV_01377 [Commensalibacter sp. Nvir]